MIRDRRGLLGGLARVWLIRAVLWLGVGLCVLATARATRSVSHLHLSLATWVCLAAVPLLGWALVVASWRNLVTNCTGETVPWLQAVRQSGLILAGKYVPGGVFGFVARAFDTTSQQRASGVTAGLIEQALGVLAPIAIGSILYSASYAHCAWLLLLLPLCPFLVAAVGGEALRLARLLLGKRVRWLGGEQVTLRWSQLLFSSALLCAQQLIWAFLAWQLARQSGNIPPMEAMGVAGSFGLAIAIGMLVLVAPGGIGVREGALVALTLPWLDANQSVVIASVMRLANVAVDLLAGVIAVLVKRSGGL